MYRKVLLFNTPCSGWNHMLSWDPIRSNYIHSWSFMWLSKVWFKTIANSHHVSCSFLPPDWSGWAGKFFHDGSTIGSSICIMVIDAIIVRQSGIQPLIKRHLGRSVKLVWCSFTSQGRSNSSKLKKWWNIEIQWKSWFSCFFIVFHLVYHGLLGLPTTVWKQRFENNFFHLFSWISWILWNFWLSSVRNRPAISALKRFAGGLSWRASAPVFKELSAAGVSSTAFGSIFTGSLNGDVLHGWAFTPCNSPSLAVAMQPHKLSSKWIPLVGPFEFSYKMERDTTLSWLVGTNWV